MLSTQSPSGSSVADECRQMQQDEILALDSIYNDQLLDDQKAGSSASEIKSSFTVESNEGNEPPVLAFLLPGILPRPVRVQVRSIWTPPSTPEAGPSRPRTVALKPTAASFTPKQAIAQTTIPSQQSDLSATLQDLSLRPRRPESGDATVVMSREREERGSNGFTGQDRREKVADAAAAPSSSERGRGRRRQRGRKSGADVPNKPGETAAGHSSTEKASTSSQVPPDDSTSAVRQGNSHAFSADEDIQPVQRTETSRLQKLPPIMHLPPVTLRIRLPPSYPLEAPPEILSLEAAWLPPAKGSSSSTSSIWMRKRLQAQYDELGRAEALWVWAQWLAEGMWEELLNERQGGALPFTPGELNFDGKDEDDIELEFEERLDAADGTPLLSALILSHSRLCSRDEYDTTTFDCGICLENRKGRKCTKLEGCGHVFCSECLVAYLSMLVDEGFHRQAKRCPDPECVKMRGEMEKRGEDPDESDAVVNSAKVDSAPVRDGKTDQQAATEQPKAVKGSISRSELSTILTPDQLTRLDRLSIKARMEADPSITYCPRSGCQAAVLREPGDEGIWERFRQCTECGFSFCAWCSRSWHGTNPCPVSFHADLVKKYRSLTDGSAEKKHMELSFGKSTLLKLVEKFEEEEKTREWMKSFTTPCPTCSIAIEKSFGCNHMTCQSCRTHYCYLCGKSISATNPYLHFNTPGAGCYNRLFDGITAGGLGDGQDGRAIDMADFIPWDEILDD